MIHYRTLFHGVTFDAENGIAGLTVAKSEADWERHWAGMNHGCDPLPAVPAVHFATESVLILALGGRPSSGYLATIEEIAAIDGSLHVRAREQVPGGPVLEALTYPFHAVAIARTDMLPGLDLTWRAGV